MRWKQLVLKIMNDIDLFFSKGASRSTNDSNNRKRENILVMLQNVPYEYFTDPTYGKKWEQLATKWNNFLKTLCPSEYHGVRITKVANLSNHDLLIEYVYNDQVVHKVLGEFKHNAKSITKLTEYYSAPEKKGYISKNYAEYFYDNFLDKICTSLELQKIERNIYMKHIYQRNYNLDPFFRQLKDLESTIYKEKQTIVRNSIKEYLNEYAMDISIEKLNQDISPQSQKTFILWDCNEFYSDRIREDELKIVHIEKVKNNNTIVAMSKAGTRHNLLLRWKNHLGILYPAWQISLQR